MWDDLGRAGESTTDINMAKVGEGKYTQAKVRKTVWLRFLNHHF